MTFISFWAITGVSGVGYWYFALHVMHFFCNSWLPFGFVCFFISFASLAIMFFESKLFFSQATTAIRRMPDFIHRAFLCIFCSAAILRTSFKYFFVFTVDVASSLLMPYSLHKNFVFRMSAKLVISR